MRYDIGTDYEKKFLVNFHRLSYDKNSWSVWQDFVTVFACSLANAVDKRENVWREREDRYLSIIKRYSKEEAEIFPKLLASTTMALEENPEQDFLGGLYMQLGLGSHWHGQFFTPWSVSELMADVTIGDSTKEQIEERDYITVADFACGAGCMLMAFANSCKNKYDINYQQRVLFVAQDIDEVVALMCYIQMSLLGCAGYVVVGNSLTEPVGGDALFPYCKDEGKIWYTPMFFHDIWQTRRLVASLDSLFKAYKVEDKPKPAKPISKNVPVKPTTPPPYEYIRDFFKKRRIR